MPAAEPSGSTWGPYWARWLDGSLTPAAHWSPEADRDCYRQVLVLREAAAERGWLGSHVPWDVTRPYWGCGL